MKCKICNFESKPLFSTKVLSKYDVQYYQCPNCDFIQTEKAYWLKEAYNHAITDLDIGLVYRNLIYSTEIYKIITSSLNVTKKFLDFAGGYGLFVRIMRDKGLSFYHHDKYCENIFSKNHEFRNLPKLEQFEGLTALEVFEHLDDPLNEIKVMEQLTNTIIFSTELIPNKPLKSPDDWWYFVPETGQHIAFYSIKTLNFIAKKLNLHLYSNNFSIHIFSKTALKNDPFTMEDKATILPSLLDSDFAYAQKLARKSKKTHNNNSKSYVDDSISFLFKLNEELRNNKLQLEQSQKELTVTVSKLREIYSSMGWRILRHIYTIRDKFIPKNSKIKKILKTIISVIVALKTRSIKSNIIRNINTKSKKIAFIDHSFHQKTKSNVFIIDILKQHFDVEIIQEDSWQGKPYPDLSHIDNSYLGVIFFQDIPSPEIYNSINNENKILVPMYDHSGGFPQSWWNSYPNLKVINFSNTLHKKLTNWGLESMYIQRFPNPEKFIPGSKDKAFFYSRAENINFDLVKKLIGHLKIKIHIHKTMDPGSVFKEPLSQDIKKYHITYSEWFKEKADKWKATEPMGILIAPRLFEGIGQDFIEGMAYGKAVIAPNNPTMNEYIVHNKTGYLYDIDNPKPIDISNIKDVQKNAHKYIKQGYKKWLKEKQNIINFIVKN